MGPVGLAEKDFLRHQGRAGGARVPCAWGGKGSVACRASAESGLCRFEWDGFRFGVAERSAHTQIAALVERLYARRGYRTDNLARSAESPHRTTFAGIHDGRFFATLSLGLDSADGLLVDELYRADVDTFRSRQRRICELSTFAIDPQYRAHGVHACLFHLAYLYGRKLHQVTDAFIEVNPRHAGFYERVFHFRRIGELRHCPRVDAAAVLLHLDLQHFDAQWADQDRSGAAAADTVTQVG
jgi:hypothetical protein